MKLINSIISVLLLVCLAYWINIANISKVEGTSSQNDNLILSSTISMPSYVSNYQEYGLCQNIKLNNCTIIPNAQNSLKNNTVLTSKDGKKFVEFGFLIYNNSSQNIEISSALCFNASVDRKSISENLSAKTLSNFSSMDGTILPYTEMQGSVCYEFPVNWKEAKIHIQIPGEQEVVVNYSN